MQKSNNELKYFLYARKSSESEDRQVQSLDDQVNRLGLLAKELGIKVINLSQPYTEAKSAKQPGKRPLFEDMLRRIENGEAQGILCWQINRLTRNPVDAGAIQWMLQQGTLKAIQTIDRVYKPEDNALLFSVESGMANQFIIDLKINTKRGMESKLEKGWAPNLARLGYLNDVVNKTIIKDPERFDVVKQAWQLMLTGNFSLRQILQTMNEDWGFTTLQRKQRGGKPLSLSGLYSMFYSKFYAGVITWGGQEVIGKHEPMITMEEFERVQDMLRKHSGKPRPQKHFHAYSGLITCGECGAMVTAETKKKLVKSEGIIRTYNYYHCTHRKKYVKCTQRGVITEDNLSEQIEAEILRYTILPEFKEWALEVLRSNNDQEIENRTKVYEMQHTKLVDTQRHLDNLTQMRYRELISDEEFTKERAALQSQITNMQSQLRHTENRAEDWVDLSEKTFMFAAHAHERFQKGSVQVRKEIFAALGQNFSLKDGKLSIEANKWLVPIAEHYPALEAEYKRLEPTKTTNSKAQNQALDLVRTSWGG